MPSDTKWNFDWSGRMEQLEERLAMSADPLGGSFEHHAINDAPPALDHHTESTPDFWIDSTDREVLNDLGRQIDQALEEAHGQTGLLDVRADYGFTGIGQTVAVIDSGIAYDHFALGGGFGSNYRVVGGWDFTGENDADPYDDGPSGSHGSHVAGIVGGDSGNDTGVAPGVDLVALRVFDDAGAGYFSWVEDALTWVHDNRNSFENPITAINLSLGVSGWNSDTIPAWANLEDEFAQLEADGIFIAVSAGNSYSSFNTTGLSYPAASSYVIPVMSTDDSGLMSYFSQRHSRAIAAPGRWITSTVPDYAGNNNGIADDYATKSGTSMAAPYVAGASVIIREAMEFAGYTNITQDTIYDHMMATADSFFDSATNQSYSRLNVQAAVDALMPADDFGSDIASAYSLGTINNPMTMSGAIANLTDVDYFAFTAASTGTVTFEVTNMTHELTASWLVSGPQSLSTLSSTGNSVTVDVVAGQDYTLGFASGDGIGYYDFDVTAESTFTFTDWGSVEFTQLDGLSVTNDTWYRVEATSSGYLTVDSSFDGNEGQVGLEFYDSGMQLVDTGNAVTGTSRVDAYVSAGDELYIKVLGTNSDVDFRLTNLVSLDSTTVNVAGTSGDDTFAFTAGDTHVVSVNGVEYNFASIAIDTVNFSGSTGIDSIVLNSTGSLQLSVGGIEQVSNLDANAFSLKLDLRLESASNDYLNWGGLGERWLTSESNTWYFITPEGELHRWNGGNDLSSSTLIASLNARFHNDLSLLLNATTTEFINSSEAISLDDLYSFETNGNYYDNWGGMNEKWISSTNDGWFFITSSGDLYQWQGNSNLAQCPMIGSLGSRYYADPTLLLNTDSDASPHTAIATALNQQLGLVASTSYSEDWGNWNEKWIRGSSNQWHFITPSGGFYHWKGGNLNGSELLATLSPAFHTSPELLFVTSPANTESSVMESMSNETTQIDTVSEIATSVPLNQQTNQGISSMGLLNAGQQSQAVVETSLGVVDKVYSELDISQESSVITSNLSEYYGLEESDDSNFLTEVETALEEYGLLDIFG